MQTDSSRGKSNSPRDRGTVRRLDGRNTDSGTVYSRKARQRETTTTQPSDRTAIGIDLGEHNLYTACPVSVTNPTDAYTVRGTALCTCLDELRAQTARLLGSEYDRDTIAAYVQQRRDELVTDIDAAARDICEYALTCKDPILVTEDTHFEPDLWLWLTAPTAHCGSSWLLAAAHLRLRTIAAEYTLEVRTVPEAYSSQECHACGVLGDRHPNETFWCSNVDCQIDHIDADFNAAKVLAQRYYAGKRCARRSPRS